MRSATTGSPWDESRLADRPYLVAHRANTPALIQEFAGYGADFIETDLWVHRGLFESRHERALYPVPLLFERWYLRRRPPVFDLVETVRNIGDPPWLFLDLKNGGSGVVPLVSLARETFPDVPLSASATDWRTLRILHDNVPEIDVFYSVEVQERLDLFFSVVERDPRPIGISCRAGLLTQGIIERFHALGLRVVAWTIDQLDVARRLAAWGVDGITTHKPAELRAALQP